MSTSGSLTAFILQLTFVFIVGCDGEDGVLDVLIFIDLSLVEMFVKVWRVVVLVRNRNSNEFSYWKKKQF
jgi:hypothetical protein